MPQIRLSINDDIYKQLKEDADKNFRTLSNELNYIATQYFNNKSHTIPYTPAPIIREPVPEECFPKKPIPVTVGTTIADRPKPKRTVIGGDDDVSTTTQTQTQTFKSIPDKSQIPEGYTNSPFNDRTLVINPDNPDEPELDTLIAFLDKEDISSDDDSRTLYEGIKQQVFKGLDKEIFEQAQRIRRNRV